MDQSMKDNSSMEFDLGSENGDRVKPQQRSMSTKDNIKMTRKMVLESIGGQMGLSMRDFSKMIWKKDKEL